MFVWVNPYHIHVLLNNKISLRKPPSYVRPILFLEILRAGSTAFREALNQEDLKKLLRRNSNFFKIFSCDEVSHAFAKNLFKYEGQIQIY